jgi:non-heme chloroperoxidase
MNYRAVAMIVLELTLAVGARSQEAWHDPSPHTIHFVTVQEGVRLEVLEWGGSGRDVVMLAGSGNSAHVFDDFAPKLAGSNHVYGVTRRGFGASSQPTSGYDEPRLAADLFEVINRLGIKAPVVVGHSMAGGEMTILASEHPDRVSGLVYMDALFDVADYPASDPAYMALAKKLPAGKHVEPPTPEEQTSFARYRARQLRDEGFAFPESELHAGSETTADGSKGKYKTPQWVFKAIGDGAKPRDYSSIRVPVLSISEAIRAPGDYGDGPPPSQAERAVIDEFRAATKAFGDRWKKNLQSGPPSVRFVDLAPGAGHYLFLTKEADVIHELQSFLTALK